MISFSICAEPALDVVQVLQRDDAAGRQHLRVRKRTLDVEHRQLAVEADRRGVALDQFSDRFIESSRPGIFILHCRPHLTQNEARKTPGLHAMNRKLDRHE